MLKGGAKMKNVLGCVCVSCGKETGAEVDTTTCPSCGGMLDVKYDYAFIKTKLDRQSLASSADFSMWRYLPLLPIEEGSELSPLRVGWSPLYKADGFGESLGLKNLYIKDDGLNPTSSLKDRASAIAAVRAKKAGKNTVACSSTGNAASSLAGNAAAMGLKSFIFVPERAPKGKVAQLLVFGAHVFCVKGNYEDAFRLSAEAISRWGWYNRNAAINPYLMEGKKTVSLEIAEQLGFKTPDYVAVSVGDGCTIAGVWKGFKDLYALGLLDKLPRLISVQASLCCPINRAAETGNAIEKMDEDTIADSIAVGVPRNGDKALAAIRESNGITVNVTDDEILSAMRRLGAAAGVFGEPAGAAGSAGLIKLAEQKRIPPNALVVSIVTGNGLKDVVNAQKAAGEPNFVNPDMASLSPLVESF
jgi:threonine synthase